jgi:CheY-like chemotaxis protein
VLVRGDPTQLQQVLINLCTNAVQAIGNRSGRIEIHLECCSVEQPRETVVGQLIRGDYAMLSVRDSGSGIDPQILERIFEPFFTTKEVGKGTGLGLAMVHNVVLAHAGAIDVSSSPGEGTIFTIFIPSFVADKQPPPETKAVRRERDRNDSETSLRVAVIDDEKSIVDMNAKALQRAGYIPVVYENAEACLSALRADPGCLDLVITDQTMPGMTGSELIRCLRNAGIQIPVLLLSGYSRLIDASIVDQNDRVQFLAKPFSLDDLIREADSLTRGNGASSESGGG